MTNTERSRIFREKRKALGLPGVDPKHAREYYQKNKEMIREKRRAKRKEDKPTSNAGRPRKYHTAEEKRLAHNKRSREAYKASRPNYAGRPVYTEEERRLMKNAKAARYREKIRGEKPAPQKPNAKPHPRVTNSKAKPIKEERSIRIPKDAPEKVKVRLDARTEVLVLPGYNLEALKARYGIKI